MFLLQELVSKYVIPEYDKALVFFSHSFNKMMERRGGKISYTFVIKTRVWKEFFCFRIWKTSCDSVGKLRLLMPINWDREKGKSFQYLSLSILIRVYTVCQTICIFWTHYCMVYHDSTFLWVFEYFDFYGSLLAVQFLILPTGIIIIGIYKGRSEIYVTRNVIIGIYKGR